MADYIHPARPEYLRRGTPVVLVGKYPGVVIDVDITKDGARVCAAGPDTAGDPSECWWDLDEVPLDFRDPTARAHAAWAYTFVLPDGTAVCWHRLTKIAIDARVNRDDFSLLEHLTILCRMAAGDLTVTVAEARAALLWAEGVIDASRGPSTPTRR